jgi:Cu/Ag efflux protein CusF
MNTVLNIINCDFIVLEIDMKTTLYTTLIASTLVFSSQATFAAVETYQVHGVVEHIDAAAKTITLSQNSVTELGWPARTMNYTVDGNNILSKVSQGESVDVTFTADSPYHPVAHFINPANR